MSGPHNSLAMYVDPKKVMGIEGMPEIEAQALLHELLTHLVRDEFMHTHAGRLGDVVFG